LLIYQRYSAGAEQGHDRTPCAGAQPEGRIVLRVWFKYGGPESQHFAINLELAPEKWLRWWPQLLRQDDAD
jgi:hypothetical protein